MSFGLDLEHSINQQTLLTYSIFTAKSKEKQSRNTSLHHASDEWVIALPFNLKDYIKLGHVT